jgi:hypothetical protein
MQRLLPVTIGLFGDWGSGKSSILGMVEEVFESEDQALCLRFDGWLFENYDDARAALMQEILSAIQRKRAQSEDISEKAKRLLRRVDWFRIAGLAAKGILTVSTPFSAAGLLAAAAQLAPDLLAPASTHPQVGSTGFRSLIAPELREVFENIREFRQEFAALVQQAGLSPVVILIDDLDRCLPESIISTLEAIKLFLAVPGTSFVIAADERIVRHAIALRYPQEEYGGQDLPQDYLEKLIQIPIKIPPLTRAAASCYMYLLFAEKAFGGTNEGALERLGAVSRENSRNRSLPEPMNYGIAKEVLGKEVSVLENDFSIVERISDVLNTGLAGNPRLIKRFLNTFSLRLTMSQAMGTDLRPEVLAKLMVLERFHEDRFRELYEWQLQQSGLPAEIKRLEESARLGDTLEHSLSESEEVWLLEESIREWLSMEPQLANVRLTEYFSVARETLHITTRAGRQLPPAFQVLVANLHSGTVAIRASAVPRVLGLAENEIEAIVGAVLPRAMRDPTGSAFLGLVELSGKHEKTGRRLLAACKNLDPRSLTGAQVFRVAGLKQRIAAYGPVIDELLSSWKQSSKHEVATAAQKALSPPDSASGRPSPRKGAPQR